MAGAAVRPRCRGRVRAVRGGRSLPARVTAAGRGAGVPRAFRAALCAWGDLWMRAGRGEALWSSAQETQLRGSCREGCLPRLGSRRGWGSGSHRVVPVRFGKSAGGFPDCPCLRAGCALSGGPARAARLGAAGSLLPGSPEGGRATRAWVGLEGGRWGLQPGRGRERRPSLYTSPGEASERHRGLCLPRKLRLSGMTRPLQHCEKRGRKQHRALAEGLSLGCGPSRSSPGHTDTAG
ncbi:uncharacterized protein LOC119700930 isoform X1 [Motacilla alba alba]|uniref:uncharacterized protein LOC119700930 isoform X1 n=1 Tax=Motacilla alba alba TaxID=1094192 RepID=UPI0018D528FA|nr:uncharacterized protein LOC119700930 isoform X1 [Motacilla alba alba]